MDSTHVTVQITRLSGRGYTVVPKPASVAMPGGMEWCTRRTHRQELGISNARAD
ncbi:MAG: hypothetical protein IT445_15340 [Phycisphaeraceae bacterium]|nr:hypothetical protein [Phycisphaeraceae bacterium]